MMKGKRAAITNAAWRQIRRRVNQLVEDGMKPIEVIEMLELELMNRRGKG